MSPNWAATSGAERALGVELVAAGPAGVEEEQDDVGGVRERARRPGPRSRCARRRAGRGGRACRRAASGRARRSKWPTLHALRRERVLGGLVVRRS
ncbi:MAG: hypothetical protein U5P41_04890 [Gammaproteobacteria bacterium]|nr:hypothetical protein [Gammaproteobacteria bacterium]